MPAPEDRSCRPPSDPPAAGPSGARQPARTRGLITPRPRDRNWQETLARECHPGDDPQYAEQLGICLACALPEGVMASMREGGLDWLLAPFSWLAHLFDPIARPYPWEVEAALRRACAASADFQEVWGPLLERLGQERRRLPPVADLLADLWHDDWRRRFQARQLLARWGGEAVAPLTEEEIWPPRHGTVLWLLRSIEADTRRRLAGRATDYLCPRCLVRCDRHRMEDPLGLSIVFYGCRACRQSRLFWDWPGPVVALLDEDREAEPRIEAEALVAGALARRALFDFDWVEIRTAGDEAVERFALQVANDTDDVRRRWYPRMACLLAPGCRLAPNTIRILERLFGEVRRG